MTRRTLFVAAAAVAVIALTVAARAQSPLGIGSAEPSALPSDGGFGLFTYVNDKQQAFYRALTGALKAMREDPARLWTLVGLSFAYGVFHAAGPGHGKAVISSYMIANEVALRRGIVLSFLSSMLQGASAILVVGLAYVALRGTTVTMTEATRFLELASYLLVAAFGAWLLWRKIGARLTGRDPHGHHHGHAHAGHGHHHHPDHEPMLETGRPALALAAVDGQNVHASAQAGHAAHARRHDDHDRHDHVGRHHHHDHDHHGHDHHAHTHHHGPDEVCATCGHLHAPDPTRISGKDFSLREAWSAVVAVGLRPCSGALLVLSFSLLNGLYLGGLLSVLAMAIGTAITVSALAIMAVSAKGLALKFAGSSRADTVGFTIEVLGASFVLVIGVVLFLAAIQA